MKAAAGSLACLLVGWWCGRRTGYASGYLDGTLQSFSSMLRGPR